MYALIMQIYCRKCRLHQITIRILILERFISFVHPRSHCDVIRSLYVFVNNLIEKGIRKETWTGPICLS